MNASMLNVGENQPRLKVSIIARLMAAFTFAIPAIGGALSSLLLLRVFRALAANESAGIVAVMGGMKEASLPAIISLYLAVFCGFVVIIVLVIRMFVETKTASPPIWFFVIGGILCLIPAGLFWKAQMSVIEVLSQGSAMSVGGIGSVGAYLSQLLLLSVIAAPIVILVLLVVAVVPFSSGSKVKWLSLVGAILMEILLIAVAVAIPFLIGEPKRMNESVKLPDNIKYADSGYDIEKESSMVLSLTAENKLSQRQFRDLPDNKVERMENIITKEELPEKIKSSMRDKTPDKRIVYFKGDANASVENVLQIFESIRKADIEKVGLVVIGAKNEDDPYQISPRTLEVKLPSVPEIKTNEPIKPNPLILVAKLETDGKLMLNNEDLGTISDTKRLENKLIQIFKDRESNGVFREGTNEIVKTVFLKVSKSSKYGDFIKLVEAVKGAGAEPIGIPIDGVNLLLYR